MILILSIGGMFRSRFGEYAGWAQAVSKQIYVEKKNDDFFLMILKPN